MNETRGGERPFRPSAIKKRASRAVTAGLVVAGSLLAGAGIEATTGVVSKTAGNMAQAGKELAKGAAIETGDWLDRNDLSKTETDQYRQNLQKRAAEDQKSGVTVDVKPTK